MNNDEKDISQHFPPLKESNSSTELGREAPPLIDPVEFENLQSTLKDRDQKIDHLNVEINSFTKQIDEQKQLLSEQSRRIDQLEKECNVKDEQIQLQLARISSLEESSQRELSLAIKEKERLSVALAESEAALKESEEYLYISKGEKSELLWYFQHIKVLMSFKYCLIIYYVCLLIHFLFSGHLKGKKH